MAGQIRVVIVDDSPLMQRVLTGLLEQDPAIQVVGTAWNGQIAIELVERLRPDVVTMDVRMPVMDGLATTQHLMAYCPTPILVLTALAQHDVDITFKMLGAGALDIVEKPAGNDPMALGKQAHDLIRRVKLLARVKVVRHLRGRRKTEELNQAMAAKTPAPTTAPPIRASYARVAPAPTPIQAAPTPKLAFHATFPLIMIGASTGGPRAVNQILSALPADLHAAVVVVQHIAEGFSGGMAEWLALHCRLPVVLAQEEMELKPGVVLIAPDRRDLLLQQDGRIHLSRNSVLLQCPSVDVAMQAAAAVYGQRCIGVLLTGMGRDGAYGMMTIRRAGGHTIAQDEATSAIFGMPKAAIDLGAAAEILPIAQIAARLVQLVKEANDPR
ncbi:chemotaxis-specific protein-glutamate methyltransferase CheB [Chloroflexia bacterium SDU3-3]|nr:chemotaxis-specific protein-glutamate methyltransferase CheB [Chloroflexia bacterium SDU3-3]